MLFQKRKIKRSLLIVLFFLITVICLFSSNLQTSYEDRLLKSSAYQKLKLELLSARQSVDTYSDIFDPYLSLNLESGGLLVENKITDFGKEKTSQTNLNMSADLKLFHVFGTSVGLSLPIQYTSDFEGESDFTMNNFGLNISRDLISEENAEKLGIRAQYYNALYSIEQQEWTLFIELVNDICNQNYYSNLAAVNQKRIEIYTILIDSTKDENQKDTYKQQKLLAQKALLNTQMMLEQIALFPSQELDTLYDQINSLVQKMYAEYLDMFQAQPSKKIKALELEVEKALAEKELWFLPYIFNPKMSFKLDYYFNDSEEMGFQAGDLKWSIGVTGSLDLLDRGERDTASLQRENTYDIKLLELKEEKERIKQQLTKVKLDIEISQIDLELKELDYKEKMKEADKQLELYKEGFITLEDKQLSLLEMEQSRLDYIQALHQLYINQLTLMKESGTSLGGYLYEKTK